MQFRQQSLADSRILQTAEDMVLFFLQLTASTFLVATSLNLKPINEMEQHGCPFVELPPDLTCIAMSIALLVQIFSKGSCKGWLVISWITSITITNVCLYLIHSQLYFWINATYFFLLAISYELERQTLRHFIKSVMAIEVIEYNAELQLELANQIIHEGEQSLQAKRSIVRHVGHEIRTPLNTIAIGGDILAQELAAVQPPLCPSTIEIVTSIQEASANALETVNELLCFEKISAGMVPFMACKTHLFAHFLCVLPYTHQHALLHTPAHIPHQLSNTHSYTPFVHPLLHHPRRNENH